MKKEKWEKRDEAMRRPLDDLQLEASLNFFFFSFFFFNKKKSSHNFSMNSYIKIICG